MRVSVVTRTDDHHRIIESVHLGTDEAEGVRQDIIRRYAGVPNLCRDTEVDTFAVQGWSLTRTVVVADGYPMTEVLVTGVYAACKHELTTELNKLTLVKVVGDTTWLCKSDSGDKVVLQLHAV